MGRLLVRQIRRYTPVRGVRGNEGQRPARWASVVDGRGWTLSLQRQVSQNAAGDLEVGGNSSNVA